jgi:CxxC-x17-CxxC domain-containing protein
MKKRIKHKSSPAAPRAKPDIAGLIYSMQQQLVSLERKVDILVGRSSPRLFEEKNYLRSVQPASQPNNYIERKQENRFRERTLHKAVCADCHKECEVPFKPSPDRPVYCKECFSKRKNGGSFNARPDSKPGKEDVLRAGRPDKHRSGEAQKPAAKKKASLRNRKKRS